MAESQDATLLQRRARRRLVGAIALVIFVVLVFPIVLEKERKPVGQDLVIQIPSHDAGKFNTRVLPPKAPMVGPEAQQGATKSDAPITAANDKPAQSGAKAESGAKPEPSPAKPQAISKPDSAAAGQGATAPGNATVAAEHS